MKRKHVEPDDNDDEEIEVHGGKTQKRSAVLYETFKKWQRDFDKELQSLAWLDCVTTFQSGKKVVVALRCSICCRFKERIQSLRNFSDKWILGADSLRTSNIRDCSKTNQHVQAMRLLAKEHATARGDGPSSYAPILQAMSTLSDTEKTRLKRKFDIAYLVATEKMSFLKYPALCEMEKNMVLISERLTQMNVQGECLFITLQKQNDKC